MRPEGQHLYVHHTIVDEMIYFWSWQPDKGNRLYTWPYTRDEVKKLNEGNENGEGQDGPMVLEFDGDNQTIELRQSFDIIPPRIEKPREELDPLANTE